jgi:hypothetical protein
MRINQNNQENTMKLNQQILIHSTEEIKEYPDAKQFVEDLAHHLKVESELPAGMSMISVGQTTPDEQYQDSPWLELDESGNPIALKFYNGAAWVDIVPYNAVKSTSKSQYIQRFGYTLDVRQANRMTWVHSLDLHKINGTPSEFKFPRPFKSGTFPPTVQIIPKRSSVYQNGPSGNVNTLDDWEELRDDVKQFDWVIGEVTSTGFTIWTKSWDAIPAGSERAFQFDVIATGEMEE